jgi:two-component system LytT family response regulator
VSLTVRAIIVDDEPLARRHLRTLLGEDPEIAVVAECATGVEAIDAIHEHAPDLVFLDIQMPELDGVGVAEAVGAEAMPLTIFVTAHDDRALDAFRVQALDYLLKPVERERFAAALARAKDALRGKLARDPARMEAMLAALRTTRERPERLVVRSEGRTLLLRTREIDWVEADDNNVIIHILGRKLRVRETLAHIETRLATEEFKQVHRSALINVNRVAEIRASPQGEYVVTLVNGSQVRTGRRYRDAVRALIVQPR